MSEPHLSPQAHERLRQELEERSTTRRREISLWIERAREHGDISENADYDAAKNEQGHNEARVRQLEAMFKNAVVLDTASAGDVVEPVDSGRGRIKWALRKMVDEGQFDGYVNPGRTWLKAGSIVLYLKRNPRPRRESWAPEPPHSHR